MHMPASLQIAAALAGLSCCRELSTVAGFRVRQVFEQAICGLLRADGATVLMTTNATHLLSKLDQVWVMQEGSIVCSQPHALPIEPRTEDGAGDADAAVSDGGGKGKGTEDGDGAGKKGGGANAEGITVKEDKAVGKVTSKTYRQYGDRAGGTFVILNVVLLFGICQTIRLISDVWLAVWARASSLRAADSNFGGNKSFGANGTLALTPGLLSSAATSEVLRPQSNSSSLADVLEVASSVIRAVAFGSRSGSNSTLIAPAPAGPTSGGMGVPGLLMVARSFCPFSCGPCVPLALSGAWLQVDPSWSQVQFAHVYALFVLGLIVTSFLRTTCFIFCTLKSSRRLHDDAFAATMGTRLRFFESTPVGRILNRFSNDLDKVRCRTAPSLGPLRALLWW